MTQAAQLVERDREAVDGAHRPALPGPAGAGALPVRRRRRPPLHSADVNGYIRGSGGDDFTAKDFRTWAGTVLAATALGEAWAARVAGEGARGVRPTNRDVARAISDVAQRLGNTAAVCRKCYVHPAIIASYLEGALPTALAARRHVRLPRPTTGLRPQEAAVLRLLERREADERRGVALSRQLRGSLRLVQGGKGRRTRPR